MTGASAYVDDASDFAKALTLGDMVRAGDYGNAMRRVSRKFGVSFATLKALNYNPPKKVDTADFVKLGLAYGKQKKAGRMPVEITPRTAIAKIVLVLADAMDGTAGALDKALGAVAAALESGADAIDSAGDASGRAGERASE